MQRTAVSFRSLSGTAALRHKQVFIFFRTSLIFLFYVLFNIQFIRLHNPTHVWFYLENAVCDLALLSAASETGFEHDPSIQLFGSFLPFPMVTSQVFMINT